MWWETAGFGKIQVINQLEETSASESAEAVAVHRGILAKAELSGTSLNTLSGTRRSVVINLLENGFGRPGTRTQVSLGWGKLFGPPVPDTWSLNYVISAPGNEGEQVEGHIPIETPHGERPMLRFTFRYETKEGTDEAWYAVNIDHYNRRDGTWRSDPTSLLGSQPAARGTEPATSAS